MNLDVMLKAQRELDERINRKHGLKDKDTYADTILALQVELAEAANEGRWFKYWSEDQEPRTEHECAICGGNGTITLSTEFINNGEGEQVIYMACEYCDGCGCLDKNPLLEEYVDGIHFFLSAAIKNGWEDALWLHPEAVMPKEEFDGGMTGIYLEMLYFLNKSHFENPPLEQEFAGIPLKQYWFRTAWVLFITIGLEGFGFTEDEIENAYFRKNRINHERQATGY